MIRRIDRIVLWMLILCALFVGFMAASGDRIPVAAGASALSCLLLRRLWEGVRRRFGGRSRRARRQYARLLLNQWLLLPPEEMRDKLRALLVRRLPGYSPDESLICLPFAPTSRALDADLMLSQWRAHRGEARIVLAALCPADPSARQWAEKLSRPTLRVVDGAALEDMLIREHRAVPAGEEGARKSALSPAAFRRLLGRVHPLKASLYALLALGLYLFSGRLIYLSAFALLFTMAALRAARRAVP